MIHIDKPLDQSQIRQFASQFDEIPTAVKSFLFESFSGDQTLEFYQGLSAGLAAAYQLASLKDGQFYIGAALAATTKEVLNG